MNSAELAGAFIHFSASGAHTQAYKFIKYPDGFWCRDGYSFTDFLKQNHRTKSKRMTLGLLKAKWCSSQSILIKWSLTADAPKVIRFINGTILVWSGESFFKLPLNDDSKYRIENASHVYSSLKDTEIQNFIAAQENCFVNGRIYQKSPVGHLIPLTKEGIAEIDSFLSGYYKKACLERRDGLYFGFEHGDLHVNNILEFPNGSIKIIDLDQYKKNGMPFVDLMSFAVHFVGFYCFSDYQRAFNMILNRPCDFENQLKKYGLPKVAAIWAHDFSSKYYKRFIEARVSWFNSNEHENKFSKKIKAIAEKFDDKNS